MAGLSRCSGRGRRHYRARPPAGKVDPPSSPVTLTPGCAAVRMPAVIRWPVRLGALVPLFAYLALGALVVEAVPPWEAPDEPWHVRYAQVLATGRRPTRIDTYEAVQPPAYYLWPAWGLRLTGLPLAPLPPENAFFPFAVAAFVHPGHDATAAGVRVLRTFSGFLGLITLCFAWSAGRMTSAHARAQGFLAAGLLAVWPQFQFIAHAISNDGLASVCGALVVYALLRAVVRPRDARRALAGALLGLWAGLLVKLTVIGLAPAWAVVAIWVLRRRSGVPLGWPVAQHRRWMALSGVVLLALAWSAGRTGLVAEIRWQLGELLARVLSIDPRLTEGRTFVTHGQATLHSLWAFFGWQNLLPPAVVPLSGVLLASAAGCGLWVGRRSFPAAERRGLAVAGVAVLSALAAAGKNLLARPEPQGRFLFPALVAMSVLASAGLLMAQGRRRPPLTAGVWMSLLALNGAIFGVWMPRAYAAYGLPTEALEVRRIEAPPAALVRLDPQSPVFRQPLAIPRGRIARLHIAVARASGPGDLEMRLWAGGRTVAHGRRPLAQLPHDRWLSLDVVPPRPLTGPSLELRLVGNGWAWLWAIQPPEGGGDSAPRELMLLVASQAPPWRAAP